LQELVRAQIDSVLNLRREALAIPALTAISGGVSEAVQAQYERFPYPRWEKLTRDSVTRDWEQAVSTRDTEQRLRGKQARILVVGCGTGQEAAFLATVLPDASITAVDLSRTSLAYAKARSAECGLTNIEFYQGDITAPDFPREQFDYVSASGVLHHLEDPVAGWEICAGLLKQNGLMRVALYSETARRAVICAREAIVAGGYGSDESEMRRFRSDAPRILPRPVLEDLIGFRDYFQLSMYRDLLFHVQEHRFSLPQIGAVLDRLRLQFAGFYLAAQDLDSYSTLFADDPQRTNLQNWHEFESRFPDTFRNMYIFWCRKS